MATRQSVYQATPCQGLLILIENSKTFSSILVRTGGFKMWHVVYINFILTKVGIPSTGGSDYPPCILNEIGL